jgi:hypothetical protein
MPFDWPTESLCPHDFRLVLENCAVLQSDRGGSSASISVNIADTAVVIDSAWTTFVRDVLTPSFPEGATVFNASGQWLAPNDVLVRKSSWVVELLHPATRESETRVQNVIDACKTRCAQQAVLRMVTAVRATF